MSPEYHLFILWERARYCQEKILSDISDAFTIIRMYDVAWTPELVSSNFTRFYGENLPNHSEKEKECGTGRFLLVVVRDESPYYEHRATSHGMELVNVHMFEKKALYRQWTCGGHKIHSTNSTWEFNHDITLLLGINADDYVQTLNEKDVNAIIPISRDIVGARGWSTLEELLYVMNATITYAVMRGEEWLLPNQAKGEHGDIDVLLQKRQSAIYILNGSYYCDSLHPHILVSISDTQYIFDLWECNHGVYDAVWEYNMLSCRVQENGCYTLSLENKFYSLLYHCLINKNDISSDYIERLDDYKSSNAISNKDWSQILVEYLSSHSYAIPMINDHGVEVHVENPVIHTYAYKYGSLIKRLYEEVDNQLYLSAVFERADSFTKKGTPLLIENEIRFLHILDQYSYFPHILSEGVDGAERWVEISRIKGENMEKYYLQNHKHNTVRNIRKLIKEVIGILIILRDKNIIHRDFIPTNILVNDKEGIISSVGIIDFGWSIFGKEADRCVTPPMLGAQYAASNKLSDIYSFSTILKEYWPQIKGVRNIISQLQNNVELERISVHFGLNDYFRLFLMRHKRVDIYVSPFLQKTKHLCKKIKKVCKHMVKR